MTLPEIREVFEESAGTPILTVTKRKNDYPVVYVLIRDEEQDLYHLHRYFPLGLSTLVERWEVSLECQNKPLDVCLRHIEFDFKEIYPG
jgi:hypothetical protein